MISASFDESNHVLGRPVDMTDDECDPLSVAIVQFADGIPGVVSCWKLTQDEVDEFTRTGRIWLTVLGATMPPVSVSAINPFPK